MPRGFFNTTRPVGASYTDHLVIHIALPHGSDAWRKQIHNALVLTLSKLGISHSGHMKPVDALKHELNKEG